MTQTDAWTIGRLLTWTTDYLKQQGVDSARLDTEVLLAEARGCQRIDLYAAYHEPADETTRTAFRELVRRRAAGTPVAYLVGRREFYSMNFRVTPDVLIPRPETELLVVAAIDRIKADFPSQQVRIADVGTGSGVLAVCLAKHLPNTAVTAVDVSEAALRIAALNAADHGVADRIKFVQCDLFSEIPADAEYDLVVSNPPYVTTAEMAALAPEVVDHEPEMALHAGPVGTEVIEALVPQAADHLKPGGTLLFEISPMIEEAARKTVADEARFQLGKTIRDLAGLPRVILATRR